jgi:hypothetical protein
MLGGFCFRHFTLMKGNMNIEQRGPLGKTLPRKRQLRCLLLLNNDAVVSISTITKLLSFNQRQCPELPKGPYLFTSPPSKTNGCFQQQD